MWDWAQVIRYGCDLCSCTSRTCITGGCVPSQRYSLGRDAWSWSYTWIFLPDWDREVMILENQFYRGIMVHCANMYDQHNSCDSTVIDVSTPNKPLSSNFITCSHFLSLSYWSTLYLFCQRPDEHLSARFDLDVPSELLNGGYLGHS